jgi:hypothetical protein
MTFRELLHAGTATTPGEDQQRAARELPAAVAASKLHWWRPGAAVASSGMRLLIGVAPYSAYDLRFLDLVNQALQTSLPDAPRVDVFDTLDCQRVEDFDAYVPGIGPVLQTPVVGLWENGTLKQKAAGKLGRELVGGVVGIPSEVIAREMEAQVPSPDVYSAAQANGPTRQLPSDGPVAAARVMRPWATLVREQSSLPDPGLPTWAPVNRLIEAAKARLQAEEERLRDLLKMSGNKLHPLVDPLSVDLGTHRWLAEDREEAYSDWLAWIVEQIHKPDEILRIFGQSPPHGSEAWTSAGLEVTREEFIPADGGQAGRLDIVLRVPGKAIIVIEVKRGTADDAQTDKQAGYGRWLEQQPEPQQYRLLLVTGADQESYCGFAVVKWAQVCLELRRVAARLSGESRLMVAAMILAFVGGVEQNLLGFSVPRSLGAVASGGERHVLVDTRVVEHLSKWVNGGEE